jgi:2',3'-cyclic-nucleotide 2'-phosphodiesterase (5'-nucleotidase family)
MKHSVFRPSASFRALTLFFAPLFLISCGNLREDREVFGATTPIGSISVDLDANNSCVRVGECPIGNLVADAFLAFSLSKGYATVGAFTNGGGIRYSKDTRPSGIYPAGEWNEALSYEVFPFENKFTVVTITGAQLKSTMERSVASLPAAAGVFLQVSKEIKITVDSSKPAQKIDTSQTTITQEGERITSITINGVAYDPTASYRFITSDFVAFASPTSTVNDGLVELRNLDPGFKENLDVNLIEALQYYISIYTPVTAAVEGRITIN